MFKIFALLALCTLCSFSADYPQYWVGAGAGVTQNSITAPTGWASLGIHMGNGNYSYSTVDMTAAKSSLRTGYMRVLSITESYSLLGYIDAGLATGDMQAVGAFSGGVVTTYSLSKLRMEGLHAVAAMRLIKLSGNEVKPVFLFGVAKTF